MSKDVIEIQTPMEAEILEIIVQDSVEVVESAIQGPPGPPGDTGPRGDGLAISGVVDSYIDLPSTLTPAETGDGYLVLDEGKLYFWDGYSFPTQGGGLVISGPKGEKGEDGQIRFTGVGPPPEVIPGARLGDTYLDTSNGIIYKLN